LGDDLNKAEEVLGTLVPSHQVVFPGLRDEDVSNILPQNATSTFLGSKRYGVFIGLTSAKKIFSIRINREHAELEISKPLYGVLPTDSLETLERKFGKAVKIEDNNDEYSDYYFKRGDLLIEVSILLKSVPSYSKVTAGQLITYSVSRGL
jgi:hypothetical protein